MGYETEPASPATRSPRRLPARLARVAAAAVLTICAFVVATPRPVLAADPPALELIDDQGNHADPLTVAVPATGSVTTTVYLRRVDQGPDAVTKIQLLQSIKGAIVDVTIQPPGKDTFVPGTTPFELPGGASVVPVQVTLSAVDVPGPALGSITALIGGSRQRLAGIIATRQPAATGIVLLGGATALKQTTTISDAAMFVEIKAPAAGASGVHAVVTNLTSPQGEVVPVAVTIDGQTGPVGLVGLAQATVGIKALLPRAGDYNGALVISADKFDDLVVPLVLTRTQVEPTVEILATAQHNVTTIGCRWLQFAVSRCGESHFAIEARVRETSGSALVLSTPELLSLGRTEGTAKVDAPFKALTVTVLRDGAEKGIRVGKTLTLTGGEAATIRFDATWDPRPGTYEMRARLTSAGATPKTADVAVNVRSRPVLAFAVIAFGVFLGFLVREVWQKRTARWKQQLGLTTLDDDMARIQLANPAPSPVVAATIAAVQGEIQKLYDAADGSNADSMAAPLEVVRLRIAVLANWAPLYTRVFGLSQNLKDQYYPPLDAVRAAIVGPTNKDDLTTSLTAVKALAGAIDKSIRDALRAQIQALKADAEAQASPLGRIRAQPNKARVTANVVPLLTSALANVGDASAPSSPNAVRAAQELDEAARIYAGILGDDLLDEIRNPPAVSGVTFDWQRTRGAVFAAIMAPVDDSGDARMKRYRRAAGAYLNGLAGWLGERAKRVPIVLNTVGPLLDEVQSDLQHEDLDAALGAYDQAKAAVEDAEKHDASVSGQGDEEVRRGPHAPEVGTVSPVSAVTPATSSHPTGSQLRSKILVSERWVAFVAVLVAVPLGLAILYEPNLTWGSIGDYALAFGWGLGLHEVAGQANGYAGVRAKLTGA